MERSFIETPFFMNRRARYFESDEAFRQLQAELVADADRGDPIPGGGGIRKYRQGDESRGKGKRGGLRIIYLQVPQTREIYLLHVYPKTVKDNLTRDELKVLAEQARLIKDMALARRRRLQ